MARPGGPKPPGGWAPPMVNHDLARPGANIPGPSTAINSGNIIAPRTDIATGDVSRGVNGFAGGWSGLSSAASSAAKDLKGLYDREYARDLLNRWPWWSGAGGGSGDSGGYGSSDGGYSNPYSTSDSGYSNPYSTETGESSDSSANAESQERNDSESSSEPSKEDAANSDKETTAAKQCMEKAVLAFKKGDYAEALSQCEQAIRLAPGNANVREFRALCHFAQGKYKDAAAALYAVLADGPGWDWKTLGSFYTNAKTYTKQLRALEAYVKEHPKDAAGRFVLAYHYLVLDERDAALNQLREVVKLQPKDNLSASILKALEKAREGKDQKPAEKPAPGR